MNKALFEELISTNREIEFDYKGKRYSVTYYNDNRPDYISFAEFYKRPIDVKSIDELLKVKIGSFSLEQVIGSLPDSAFDIY